MENKEFTVSATDAGARLDVFLAAQLSVSRGRAQKLLDGATVNGAPTKASHTLREGDEIVLLAEDNSESSTSAPTPNPDLPTPSVPPVLFEDEHIMVLNKPRGLTVHPGAGEPQNTLVDVLRASGRSLSSVGPPERAGIVHRLDKETTGVIVVCKTDAAHWKLAADFAERRVTKTYTALVCGVPPQRGRVEAPIGRHHTNRKKMAVVSNGRPSITEYEVERSWPKFAQLKINLLTGRTHQIRVHLAYVHHPVVSDVVYGGLQRALSSAPNETARSAMQALSGQALHASRLEFVHPITGEELRFEAPLPEDVQHIIESLGPAQTQH